LVAVPGIIAAALILCTLGGAGWWSLHSAELSRRAAREQIVRASAQFLAPAAERMIADNSVSALRMLVADAAPANHFHSVRITLPDTTSTVIADSSPAEGGGFKFTTPPAEWKSLASHAPQASFDLTRDGRARITVPLDVPNKGPAVLEIEDGPAGPVWSDWRNQIGIGAIAAAALIAMFGFSRALHRRFRALSAIRESLAAMQAGDNDPAILAVASSFGPEADAWNRLLTERADMLAKAARTGAEQKLGDRRGGRDGDLFSLCDAMWQGLILVDERMKVKYANGAGAVFLRAKRDEMIGKDAAGFVTDAKVLAALKGLTSGSARGRSIVEVDADKSPEQAGPKLEGTGSVFRYSMRPVRKEDNAAALIVIEDITQQRVAEEARHSFVASATHELRTPLTNMRLYIDSLLEEPDQDVAKRTEAVNVLSQEVRRLERLVGDMLSVAQIESGTVRLNTGDVRLEPIFEEMKSDFAEQARQKEIKLRFDLPPKWPRLEGDRDKIVMALHNLVGNAIKYTPAGGEVVVRANTDEKTFACEVIDSGIGIKDEEQTLVFEKFYRAKDKRIVGITGTGLGLAIAREVVRLHGGDISLKSVIDKGSTFTMTLPAKAA
jgi:signal transduction histidine kinase